MSSAKLSPSLKSLISHRAHPQLGPSANVCASLADDLCSQSRSHSVGDTAWLTIMTASLFTLNAPTSLAHLARHVDAKAKTKDERVAQASLMREVGLKCISFIGIAKVINQLGALTAACNPSISSALHKQPTRLPTSSNLRETLDRGASLWTAVYKPHHSKLLEKLASYHPDLPIHILTSHYGPLLSDPDKQNHPVGRVLTSLVAIACLRAQTGVGPQVTSHVFGLKKTLEENVDPDDEGLSQGWRWLGEDEGCEWVLRSIDRICETIESEQPKSKL